MKIIPKIQFDDDILNAAAYSQLCKELFPAIENDEAGPPSIWWNENAQDKLYVIVNDEDKAFAVVNMIGEANVPIDIGWWIAPSFRGRKFHGVKLWRLMLDACAEFLKERGATEIVDIKITDVERERSEKLKQYFSAKFRLYRPKPLARHPQRVGIKFQPPHLMDFGKNIEI